MSLDHLLNNLPSLDKIRWIELLENNKIFRVNEVAKVLGYTCQIAITNGLFREIYPYAEEAVKSMDFETRIEDILRIMKKNFKEVHHDRCFEFDISTNIKEAKKFDEVKTYANGKYKTKRVKVFIQWINDDRGIPALILGKFE